MCLEQQHDGSRIDCVEYDSIKECREEALKICIDDADCTQVYGDFDIEENENVNDNSAKNVAYFVTTRSTTTSYEVSVRARSARISIVSLSHVITTISLHSNVT